MLLPLLEAFAEGFPVLVNQDQNGIGDLAGESLIAVKLLHPMEDLGRGEILALMDECLPHLVGGLVIQVLRGKRGGINGPDFVARKENIGVGLPPRYYALND